jgi:hypothetical protein
MKLSPGISLFIVVIAIILSSIFFYVSTIGYTEGTVTKTERVTGTDEEGKSVSKYLIYTDKEVLQDTDSFLFFKFNSSDIYGSIKIGQKYRFHVSGWRIPFFSMYKNVISCEVI